MFWIFGRFFHLSLTSLTFKGQIRAPFWTCEIVIIITNNVYAKRRNKAQNILLTISSSKCSQLRSINVVNTHEMSSEIVFEGSTIHDIRTECREKRDPIHICTSSEVSGFTCACRCCHTYHTWKEVHQDGSALLLIRNSLQNWSAVCARNIYLFLM